MGKEAKIGVAFITLLLGVFGYVLYKRLKDSQQPAAQAAGAETSLPASGVAEKPKLSSGPLKPATVPAATPAGESTTQAPTTPSRVRDAHSRYSDPFASGAAGGEASTDSSPSSDTPRSRSGDRYASSSPPIYGPSETSSYSDPAATTASDSTPRDPFNRQGETTSVSRLIPTADAAAALLPAVPAAESEAAAEVADEVADGSVDSNPLRTTAAGAESKTAGTTSSRFGPRSYDLYGGGSSASDTSTSTASTTGDTSHSRSRYSEPSTNRYGAESPSRQWSGSSSTSTNVVPTPSTTTISRLPASTPDYQRPRTSAAGTAQRGESYTVEPNDTFSSISEKVYGTDSYFKALQEHNRSRYPRPNHLQPGDVVSTPSLEVLGQKYPSLCPKPEHLPPAGRTSTLTSQRSGGRTYVVEEGDTLFDIARFELGKAARWVEIYERNKEVIGEDFNHLRPGTELVLPTDGQDDSFTRRPAQGLKR